MKSFSWLFDLPLLRNAFSLFRGNDPGMGVFFLFLSFIYLPPVNAVLKKKLGISIPYQLKLTIGFLIIWVTLAIGALAGVIIPN